MKSKLDYHLDITLAEVAYQYLVKKRKPLTSGNLFWTMEQICQKIDYINKNTQNKIIHFKKGICNFRG